MWKIVLGFVVFAALVLWVLSRAGASVDMGGEQHGVPAGEAPASAASPAG